MVRRTLLYFLLFGVVLFGFGGKKIYSVIRHKESPRRITDVAPYRHFLKRALSDADRFASFKREPVYTLFYDNTSWGEAQEALNEIRTHNPEFLKGRALAGLRKIDKVGAPNLSYFPGVGNVSPSLLYYMKIASDLKQHFGEMERLRVVEVGSGSGALCQVLHQLLDIEHYTIVDTCDGIRLAKRALEESGIDHVVFLSPADLQMESSDLLISHHALTESSATLQKKYLKHLIHHAKRGYLVCNFFPRHFRVCPMGRDELIASLEKVQPEGKLFENRETPDFTFLWGSTQQE